MKRGLLVAFLAVFAVAGVTAGNSWLHGDHGSSVTTFAAGQSVPAPVGLIAPTSAVLGCTADDCRVCNANGLRCEPTEDDCDCVKWEVE
ncbi:MAG TPA: hypothetical protein VHM02_00265 [Thermoanaerobaculia bacterium]|nr:hypothetical protein [Thermoanaerobaculia bacterium]